MSITKSTIVVYKYSGSTNELTIPFDYLKREFVVVALGGDGKPQKALKLGTDYRFATKTTIVVTRQYQPDEGYNKVIVRRVTDASKRIVNYQDGSILNASELNTSQLQALHVAEEARDLANYTLFVDDNNNLDARGRKIINLGDPTNPQDAVTKKYVDTASESVIDSRNKALQYRNEAEEFKNQAQGFRNEAERFKNTAEQKATEIGSKIDKADALNTQAITNSSKAQQYAADAQKSASDASVAEKNAKASDKSAAASALEAKGYASIIDPSTYITKAEYKGGFIEWKSTVIYNKGDIVLSSGIQYVSRKNGNTNKTVGENEWWRKVDTKVNVKDFGARGDGKTDDTEAFKAAFEEARIRTAQNAPNGGMFGVTYAASRVEIVIPRGIYLIRGSIPLHTYITIRGEGSPIIKGCLEGEPKNTAYIFDGTVRTPACYMAEISNLVITGARGGISIDNKNLDQGLIHIHDIELKGLDVGIYIKDAQSSKVIISDFKSDTCTNFVINDRCDQLTIKQGWISQGPLVKTRDATIKHLRGSLFVSEVLGVPSRDNSGLDIAWINAGHEQTDYYVNVTVDKTRFGGEAGSITAINSFVKFDNTYPVSSNGITIRNSNISSVYKDNTTNKASCGVRLFAIPNYIILENNVSLIDTNYIVTWWNTSVGFEKPKDYEAKCFVIKDNAFAIDDSTALHVISNSNRITELFMKNTFYSFKVIDGKAYVSTELAPSKGGSFLVSLTGCPNTAASAHYRNTVTGILTVTTGYDGAVNTFVEFTELARGTKGSVPLPTSLTLTPKFSKDGVTFVDKIPYNNRGSYRIYIEVDGYSSSSVGELSTLKVLPLVIGDYI